MPRPSRAALLAAAILAGFVPLLIVAPTLVAPDPSILSAASVAGYNTSVAYRVALAWAILGVVAAAAAIRYGWLSADAPDAVTGGGRAAGPRQRWLERAVVAAVVLVALWPPFLARSNPFVEDKIFLTALHRMHGGQVPYRDFEFLYGPLMLYPAHWWSRLVGYSAQHYYAYLALLEAAQYVLLVAFLQRLIPRFRTRVLVFLALSAFLVNPLLGLNYNGVRRLLPAAALLLLARDPRDTRVAAGAGALLGLGVAYAHDFGLTALVAAGGLYGALWLRLPRTPPVRAALTLAGVAVGTWLATTGLLLRGDLGAYLGDTRGLVARFSAGEAGFRFYWTGNALAAFALLSIGCLVLGRGIVTWRDQELRQGDCFFIAAMIATLLCLKSGLNRSDVFHLDGAFLVLAAAFLLPLPTTAMRWSPAAGRAAAALIALMGVTHLLGNAPTAAYVAHGWLNGLRAVVGREVLPPVPVFASEAPTIELERAHPREFMLDLGAYLAGSGRRGHPVLFYGELWALGEMVGVYKRDHLNDDFIYADQRGEAVGRWLERQPGAFVVMDRGWYDRLFAPPGADSLGPVSPFRPSLAKSLGEWLASVHYRNVLVERPLSEARWRRTVGRYVRSEFVRDQEFGNMVVLRRRSIP